MNKQTVPVVELELLGKTRRLQLMVSTPGWYKEVTGKSLEALITILQHQFSASLAVMRVNEAHAKALGVPVEELPPGEVVDPSSILDPKDSTTLEDMMADVPAAVYALAHWADVAARPQGRKDIAQPGELTYEDMGAQLDLSDLSGLMAAVVEVYGVQAMKVKKDRHQVR